MLFAALLPEHSARHLQAILPPRQTLFATSCVELGELLSTGSFAAALVDPQADGTNTEAVVGIIRRYPRARFIAYVQRTAPSLSAVFTLSKEGLEDVFVHPVKGNDPRFLNVIAKIEADTLASDVLAAAESKLQPLAPAVITALHDLFRRPYRYVSTTDLANEAGMSLRCLHRALKKSDLGTARGLIAMAKVIHGYSSLCSSAGTVRQVSTKLGYAAPDTFSRNMLEHLGIRPTNITHMSADKALLHLIETLHKPAALQRRSMGWSPKRSIE